MSTFILVRHGHTTAGARLTGRLPGFSLSERGREQARAVSDALASVPVHRIISSPLERTRETALPLSLRTGKEVIPDPEFLEVDFGAWAGKTFEELESDPGWKLFHAFRTGTRIPSGELMSEVQLRMVRRLESLRREYPREVIVVVSHADPIRTVLAHYLGIPLDLSLRIAVDTGRFSILRVNDWGPELLCLNSLDAAGLERAP